MFYYLEGTIKKIDSVSVVVDISGVGYKCYTTRNTLSYLEDGKKQRLYTYCNIKEDTFDIYGFIDTNEKRCFELLLGVSGVGPKAAISILSSTTPEGLAMAVITEDEKVLSSAPGIGKRTAQRVILELKDKIAKETTGVKVGATINKVGPALPGNKVSEATAALVVLGYSSAEITNALRGIDAENLTVEEIIKEVLKSSLK